MRLTELRRTTSYRLATLFTTMFGIASLGLFVFLYAQTSRYLVNGIDGWLGREQAGFAHLTAEDFIDRLAAHVASDPRRERPSVLFDPRGQRLAGTAIDFAPDIPMSAPVDRPFEFTVSTGDGQARFRGTVHRVASGNLLLIAQDLGETQRLRDRLLYAFLWGGLVVALLGLAGGVIAGMNTMARIDAVTHSTARIIAGNLSERLPTRGRSNDFDRLAAVINRMLAEIERLMHEVKGVGDNIAHDLRTPLTRLLAGLERVHRRARSVEDYGAGLEEAINETTGILNTFAALLRISEVESGARRAGFTTVDLATVAADVAELYEPIAEEKGIKFQTSHESSGIGCVAGDPSLLFEAIGNLVDNALKYTPAGGQVGVRTFVRNGHAGIEVTDNGRGIPSEERQAVLNRFYRVEKSRHAPGSGLGLALVGAVARLHVMELTIGDANPGCRVTLEAQTVPENAGAAKPAGR